MILVVGPNPCLDRIVTVRGFEAGVVWRAESADVVAGGKGLNVARSLRVLGEPAVVIGFAGGETGATLRARTASAGIEFDAVEISGTTRQCTLIIDPGTRETVVNEPGPRVTREDVARLRRRFAERVGAADAVVLTGSVPPGCPEDLYAELAARSYPRPVIVDATGAALRAAAAARPAAIKANRDEIAAAFGVAPRDVLEAARAALPLARRFGTSAIVTLGERGAVLAGGGAAWCVAAPAVRRVNAIGAGDALAAGFAAGLRRGATHADALRLGVAAAGSDVETLEPGSPVAGQVDTLLPSLRAVAVGSPDGDDSPILA